MNYKFEEFKEVGRRTVDVPMVTITKNGMLNLNKSFMRSFAKGKKYIIFHFDKANKVVGLELTNEARPNSYKIRSYRGEGDTGSVTAIAFLKYYRIPLKKSRHEAKWDKEQGLVIVDLKTK